MEKSRKEAVICKQQGQPELQQRKQQQQWDQQPGQQLEWEWQSTKNQQSKTNGSRHSKTCLQANVNSEGPDQFICSLTRAFAVGNFNGEQMLTWLCICAGWCASTQFVHTRSIATDMALFSSEKCRYLISPRKRGYSLESPRRGASNEYHNMFSWRNKKNIM